MAGHAPSCGHGAQRTATLGRARLNRSDLWHGRSGARVERRIRQVPRAATCGKERTMTTQVELRVGAGTVHGVLTVPAVAGGVVVFAHGAASSRHSPRNTAVARSLQVAGLATLLFDMLTEPEEQGEQAGGTLRFDIPLLAGRLQRMMLEVGEHTQVRGLDYGLFGASTGAAAALTAAAETPDRVRAVVSRGGRPDLAGSALGSVRCPTRLIVGGNDPEVL